MPNAAVGELGQDAGRGLVIAARVGYAAKGLVYSVLGVLAIMFVIGEEGGELTDGKGAVQQIGSQPFGDVLLWVTAIGLACYALWCIVRAVKDPGHPHGDNKRVLKRAGYACQFVWNASLAVYAAQLARGASKSSGDTQSYVAELLSWPLGQGIVAVVGVITAVFGFHQIYKAIKNKVGEELSTAELGAAKQRIVCRIARIGVAARGLVFPVIGASLVIAALRNQPGRAEGFSDALQKLAAQPYGDVLIAFVAAGLLAYGLYQLCIARYGRVEQPRFAPGRRLYR